MELGAVITGFSIFFVLIALFIYLMTLVKRDDSPSLKAFSFLAASVFLLQLSDTLRVAFEQGLWSCPGLWKHAFYFVAILMPGFISFCFVNWIYRLFKLNHGTRDICVKAVTIAPVLAYLILCVASLKTNWLYYLDENDAYHRGDWFAVQVFVPYFYMVWVVALLIREKIKNRNFLLSKAMKIVMMNIFPSVVGSMIQIYFLPQGNFSTIGACVGLLMYYIGVYLDEVGEHRRLKSLAEINEKLKLANDQLANAMERADQQMQTIAEACRGGFKIVRRDNVFNFSFVSEQLANMLGYTVDELMETSGGNLRSLIEPSDFERLKVEDQVVQTDKFYSACYRMRCKDGSWKHVEDRGRLIHTEGTEDEFWSVTVDKDEMVRIENAFENVKRSREELAEYNEIIAKAGLAVWFVIRKEGHRNKFWGNEKFYELTGLSRDVTLEDAHDIYIERIVKEDLPAFTATKEKMLSGQFAEVVYRWNHPTKGIVYNRCGGNSVRLPDGTIRSSGYYADVTEIVEGEHKQKEMLQNALEAAEASSRAKTAFLNNMSHDIRTPMNAIIGFTKLMEKESDNPQKIREYLCKLRSSGDFLLSLINNVLEKARIESGKVELNEEPVDLAHDMGGVVDIFDADIKARHLTLHSRMDVQHHFIYVDLLRVHEIVINLVSNAVKYSKEGGNIWTSMVEIPCDREGYAAYEFVVRDDGIGMSADYLPHAFDSFVRERNSTESRIVGTGLGLPIVKRLVDLMGGSISVESELGVGTTFTVSFVHRICSEEDVEQRKVPSDTPVMNMAGKRILLAEDNDLNAEIAETLLQDAGFVVERAINGVECVKKVKEASPNAFDFILMDVQMPEMNGYEATRQIRSLDDARKDIPIVAMTANAFEEDRRNAMEAGMNGHVPKPINIDVLLWTMSEVMKNMLTPPPYCTNEQKFICLGRG